MIGVIFQFMGDIVEVRVDYINCLFRNSGFGGALAPIEGLKLDYKGVCKEHPDLVDNPEWRSEAIKRFKEKLKTMENDEQRVKYVIDDLAKFGYLPLYIQKQGHRPEKIKKEVAV